MSSGAPWWAVAGLSIVSVIIVQALTLWASRLQRREARGDRWEPEMMGFLDELTLAADALLALPVWPRRVGEAPATTGPLVETLRRAVLSFGNRASQTTRRLATVVAERAQALADVIEDIRATTTRGPQGTVADEALGEQEAAADALVVALNQFTTAARRDVGVRDP